MGSVQRQWRCMHASAMQCIYATALVPRPAISAGRPVPRPAHASTSASLPEPASVSVSVSVSLCCCVSVSLLLAKAVHQTTLGVPDDSLSLVSPPWMDVRSLKLSLLAEAAPLIETVLDLAHHWKDIDMIEVIWDPARRWVHVMY